MTELTDKVAVITGAASPRGIGLALARRFAAAGAALFLVDIDGAALEERKAELEQLIEAGARVEVAQHDLSQPGEPEAMIETAAAGFGRVDILCNNAAVRRNQPFGEFDYEDFDNSVAVNLRAPFFASQAVVPIMRSQGGGRIIHTASQLGIVAQETRAIYGLTKAALIHLTKSMAFELAKVTFRSTRSAPARSTRSRSSTARPPTQTQPASGFAITSPPPVTAGRRRSPRLPFS